MIDLVKIGSVLSNKRYDKVSIGRVGDDIVVRFDNPIHKEIDIIQTDEAAYLLNMGLYICHVNCSKHEVWLREVRWAHQYRKPPERELKAISITQEQWKNIEGTLPKPSLTGKTRRFKLVGGQKQA